MYHKGYYNKDNRDIKSLGLVVKAEFLKIIFLCSRALKLYLLTSGLPSVKRNYLRKIRFTVSWYSGLLLDALVGF